MTARDPTLDRLTDEQLAASASSARRLFIEAEPGSGKTTVAAMRYGALRFGVLGRGTGQAVVAASFTRSATYELRQRVRLGWGPTTLQWPHRITTIDTLVCDLVEFLLRTGQVEWPNGYQTLDVKDSWQAIAAFEWTSDVVTVWLDKKNVRVAGGRASKAASRPNAGVFARSVSQGVCTHEEVRFVLAAALQDAGVTQSIIDRLASTVRAVVVDEVFDANELDLTIVELAVRAGLVVTIIGDPWQALYGFRGAKPELVPGLVNRCDMTRLPLSASFRWRTDEQRIRAESLRRGEGIELPLGDPDSDVDVVLASEWKSLWDTSEGVLPLAFGSAKGSPPEAAATVLLNQLTRTLFGEDATYLPDALTTLGIADRDVLDGLEDPLEDVLHTLNTPGKTALNGAYEQLVAAVGEVSPCEFKKAHGAYTKRLDALRGRMARKDQLVRGMTIHQAKGREWDRVGIRLKDQQKARLATGLKSDTEPDRQLYVACTRARSATRAV